MRDAFAFLPVAWSRAIGPLVVLALVLAIQPLSAMSGQALPSVPPVLIGLLTFLIGLVVEGALYRLSTGATEGLGPLGFQAGKVELRLLAANLQIALFLAVVLTAIAVVFGVIGGASLAEFEGETITTFDQLAARLEPWKLYAIYGVVGLVAFLFVRLCVQLSLFRAATVGEGKIVSLNALTLGEGRVLPLLTGLIVCTAPTLAAVVGFSQMGAGAPWEALVVVALLTFVSAPLTAGFLGSVWKRVGPTGEPQSR